MKTALAIITVIILCGCQTFNQSVVTITQVRKSAITELAAMYKQGLISPETDKKIEAIDAEFVKTANVAEHALIAYKEGLITEKPVGKVLAVKTVVSELLNILTPMLLKEKADALNNNLEKATQL